MSKTVYMVTSGSYSDYRVDGVFLSEKDAEAAVAADFGDDYDQIDLYEEGELPTKVGYWCASGTIGKSGEMLSAPSAFYRTTWQRHPDTFLPRPDVTHDYATWIGGWYVVSQARTEEDALKVVRDRLARRAAELLEPGRAEVNA